MISRLYITGFADCILEISRIVD